MILIYYKKNDKSNKNTDKLQITLVACEHCKRDDIAESDLSTHQLDCPKIKVKCTQCNSTELIERDKLQFHIEGSCTHTIVSCKYKDVGCNDTFKRSELSNHLSTINHLEYMVKLIDKQSLELKELSNENKRNCKLLDQQSLKIKKLSDENKKLSDQLILRQQIKYKSKWVIENFTNIFKEISVSAGRHYSPSFNVGNNSLRLNIRSEGDPLNKGHLSVYLMLDKYKELPQLSTKFTMVNNDKKKNYSLSFQHKFEKAMSFGYQKTLQSHFITTKNGWLSDKGVLTIEFSVSIIQELI